MTHPWDGHRMYDGCPDSTMQRRLDAEASMWDAVKKLCPDAHLVFFPSADDYGWQVWVDHKPLGGWNLQDTRSDLRKQWEKSDCLYYALKFLREGAG